MPSQISKSEFVLANARLYKGGLEPIQTGFVHVKDGKIAALGSELPANHDGSVQVIDVAGAVVTPGLIESQSTIGLTLVELESQSRDDSAEASFSPAYRAADGFDSRSVRLSIAKEQGITTALIKPVGGMVAGLGAVVSFAQQPVVIEGDVALFAKPVSFDYESKQRSGRGEFWMRLEEALTDAEFLQELPGSARHPASRNLSLHPNQLAVLQQVLQGELPLVLNLDKASDIERALQFKDTWQKKSRTIDLRILGGAEAWLLADALGSRKIPVMLSPIALTPSSFDKLNTREDAATLLAAAEVPLILTTDDLNIRRLRQQAAFAVTQGLPYLAALQAITSAPAQLLGLPSKGELKVGFDADLALWTGNPLDPVSQVAGLWIDGQMQNLETRQLQLARRYAKPIVERRLRYF